MKRSAGDLAHWLSRQTDRRFEAEPGAPVHGGSIHECVRWETEAGPVFVKLAPPSSLDAFEAEAEGLAALVGAEALRVPAVLAVGSTDDHALLALEWLEFAGDGESNAAAQALLGERLAMQHRVTAAEFGWHRDGTIGATPQANTRGGDWVRFWRERRLLPMLERAARGGLDSRVVERGRELADRCGAFFSSYRPVPSLLHGDLWGGNWAALAGSREPVVFDPAVYYGDRETDLAMTRLFGGFGPRFYAAYQASWPLDQAAGTRRTLYDLYHVLNHFVLFGGGYGAQAADKIERLLSEFG